MTAEVKVTISVPAAFTPHPGKLGCLDSWPTLLGSCLALNRALGDKAGRPFHGGCPGFSWEPCLSRESRPSAPPPLGCSCACTCPLATGTQWWLLTGLRRLSVSSCCAALHNKVPMKNPLKEEDLTIWPQGTRLIRCCGSHTCSLVFSLVVFFLMEAGLLFSNLSFP